MTESAYVKINKLVITAMLTGTLTILGSAAKAYVDIEKIKTRMDIYVEDQREIKEDLKEIKRDIKVLIKES